MNKSSQPLIRLVDDDASVLKAQSLFLEVAGYEVKSYSSALEFLEHDDFSKLGCLVLDVRMPKMSGLELQNELNRRKVFLPIIFLSAHGDIEMAVEAVHKGALNFLAKPPSLDKLLQLIKNGVEEHKQRIQEQKYATYLQSQWDLLTIAEKQVAEMLAKGLSNNMISAALDISERTVRSHKYSVYQKMEIENAAELSVFFSDYSKYRKKFL